VNETEAEVVRQIYRWCVEEQLSSYAIHRRPRCKGSHPASPSTAGGHKAVSSRFSATLSTKGKPTTIALNQGMSGAHMGAGGSKIASAVMARAARGAPRANGSRSACPRSSIPRPGTGRKGN
jgi:hypothetical protein